MNVVVGPALAAGALKPTVGFAVSCHVTDTVRSSFMATVHSLPVVLSQPSHTAAHPLPREAVRLTEGASEVSHSFGPGPGVS